jgi:hypothetical protein
MQSTITINSDVLQKAKQALILTHFKNVEEFIAFLIEEKLQELARQKNDPIYRVRGKLKEKKGGTALFMADKQAEIEKETRV